jgi:hypothetical protein
MAMLLSCEKSGKRDGTISAIKLATAQAGLCITTDYLQDTA